MRCTRPGTILALALALLAAASPGFAAETAEATETPAEEVDYSRLIFEAELLVVPGEAPAAVTAAGGAIPQADGTPTPAPAETIPPGPLSTAREDAAQVAPVDPTAIPRYEGEISGILENAGPYSDQLREQYESLGELYQRTGDHEKAITNFESAMHIDRVNDGLFTLRQIALVENIIESYTALNDIDEVDDHQEYLFYIQQKSYPKDDPRLLAAKEAWADWNVESYLKTGPQGTPYPGSLAFSNSTMNRPDYVAVQHPTNGSFIYVPRSQLPNVLNPNGVYTNMAVTDLYARSAAYSVSPEMIVDERLRRARDLYEEILESPNEEFQSTRNADLEHKLANIAYAVKRQMDELESNIERNSLNFNRFPSPRTQNPMVTQGYSKSRDRLEAIAAELEAKPDGDPVDTAQAYINLGDLHLAFERLSRSKESYARAIEILNAAGKTPAEVSALFNPVPLIPLPGFALHPYTRDFFGKTADDVLDYKGYIDVTLEIEESGRVRGARVIAETENTTQRLHNVLIDHLREHRMRPIVQNGTIVDEYPMTLRVHYSY